MSECIYLHLLKALALWWSRSAGALSYERGPHATTKHRAKAQAVRYFLTYSKGTGLEAL